MGDLHPTPDRGATLPGAPRTPTMLTLHQILHTLNQILYHWDDTLRQDNYDAVQDLALEIQRDIYLLQELPR